MYPYSSNGPVPRPLISLDGAKQPGLGLTVPLLEGADRIRVLQGQTDVIQAIEQAMLAELVDLEAVLHAIGAGDGLLLQVHGQLITFLSVDLSKELVDLFFFQNNG